MGMPAADRPGRQLPAVDAVLRSEAALPAISEFGRPAVVAAARQALARLRAAPLVSADADAVAAIVCRELTAAAVPSVKPVFNLTGTVLHTNLGRAPLAETAVAAAVSAMREPVTLEFDLASGGRGERDEHIRVLLRSLCGVEDATAVNNNAAAVLVVLNTLALGREVVASRGELIEIGGSFRLPDIMARAGARLVEVGTTNRTHLADYAAAIRPDTALLLKVHPSNYRIEGFTCGVPSAALADLARQRGVPLMHDLGSGVLIDAGRLGLPREPTVAEAVADGADLVTFSGDKLLGGPQAGLIVGRRDLLEMINRNPLKRALRLDKIRVGALAATLALYRDPDRLVERLPTFRLLCRPEGEIRASAERLLPVLAAAIGPDFNVEVVACRSEIGSGTLPIETIPSAALAVTSRQRHGAGRALTALAADLRRLPVPVLGRITTQRLLLDLRCLTDEARFAANLSALGAPSGGTP
jgi:L-seryl-tRNA(Ser) seleniumtransferase